MTELKPRQLILASTSVYRRHLLERLRLPFTVIASDVDEVALPDEVPAQLACRLALAKAQTVAALYPECVVIGSDQVADLNGQALGKPETHPRAVAQLQRMRGQTVIFQTAVAVVCQATGFAKTGLAAVKVQFKNLTDAQIESYLLAEKPYDCAGSAKSEGLGIALLARIDNDDPTALVGLPLIRTCQLLEAAGLKVL
ncbi:MAG: septum formation inhibitor Maf [Betaproteobacteria bacterium HGW-Betaproteobacteria-18]|nr:MAG: septum formation inhibitor Maf [Betaproteobacteria bacterium HGW-Betaproteobacteria-18]